MSAQHSPDKAAGELRFQLLSEANYPPPEGCTCAAIGASELVQSNLTLGCESRD